MYQPYALYILLSCIAKFQLVAKLFILDVMDNILVGRAIKITKILRNYTLYHHYSSNSQLEP